MSAAVRAWETDPDVDPDVFVPAFTEDEEHRAAVTFRKHFEGTLADEDGAT